MASLLYIAKQPKTKLIPFHKHSDWEIIYCTHGNGQLDFSNHESITYLQSEVLIIPPKVLHTNVSDSGFKNIHLVVSDWDTLQKNPFKISDRDGFIRILIKRLQMSIVSEKKGCQLISQNYLDLILNLIISQSAETHYSRYVLYLREKLLENFTDENFDLLCYMKEIPHSPEYLRKLFIKELGITPVQYLRKIRLENANRLLISTDTSLLNINEIAHMSGFSDSLHFSRLYKMKYGVSPKFYRQNLSNENK
ncbi:MAG: AraC family transcriptional regulator [Christensenellaceae bacterium]|jgi:AraC-like DNA-binding protein|nr:AraC family transcriptional regulator [Christensenellaceae bacterium]